MAQQSDLVRDSKLETHFISGETIHAYHEADPTSHQRRVTRFEHWQRQQEIGSGSFGSLWLEKCTKGGRGPTQVRATKQVKLHRHVDYSRELETIAKFSHPKYESCFVKSFGWFEDRENLFIAMEYLELGDLHVYLRDQPPLPEPEVKEIAFQILDGLHLMHENGFAHRDLKPKNILVKSCPPKTWWIKIADFGISKRIEAEAGGSTLLKGTHGYMAPELYGFIERGSPYAVDIWALGEIIVQASTKQPTFKHLGLLSDYAKDPGAFPSEQLLDSRFSRIEVEFIRALMHPLPGNRLAAKEALHHQWIEQVLPLPSHPDSDITPAEETHALPANETQAPLPTDSGTAGFATWDTVTTQNAQTIFSDKPLQTATGTDTEIQPGEFATHRIMEGHSGQVRTVAFSPDGRLVASGSYDGTVRLWDTNTGSGHRLFLGHHSSPIVAVAFSPNGQVVASASVSSFNQDNTVICWDITTGAVRSKFEHRSDLFVGASFSFDTQLVAYGNLGQAVIIFDCTTGAVHSRFHGHSKGVRAVAFSRDGRTVASGSDDTTIKLWDIATGKNRCTLVGHTNRVMAVAFSSDGQLVASASNDKSIRLWDATTGAEICNLACHDSSVRTVAFSLDNRLVASGSYDGTIMLWHTATGTLNSTLKGHGAEVRTVAFSPDGRTVVSASSDSTIRLWGREE